MNFDKNLAAIHGYLCGDGYVIKNPPTQPKKYYRVGLRNTNSVLLDDFQKKFEKVFDITPSITRGRCEARTKEVYLFLTKNFSYYSYEWTLPTLSKGNLRAWLRAFFDCEGWVENQPGKSRLIGLECCNKRGTKQIQEALQRLEIKSQLTKKKRRTIWRLTICGKENIQRFQTNIGFLHPQKKRKLEEALGSYKTYIWEIPTEKEKRLKFLQQKGKFRKSRNKIRVLSIVKQNLINLAKALKEYGIPSRVLGPWKSSTCSQYYCLIIKR